MALQVKTRILLSFHLTFLASFPWFAGIPPWAGLQMMLAYPFLTKPSPSWSCGRKAMSHIFQTQEGLFLGQEREVSTDWLAATNHSVTFEHSDREDGTWLPPWPRNECRLVGWSGGQATVIESSESSLTNQCQRLQRLTSEKQISPLAGGTGE
jgi:hypothetical protein